MPRPGTKVASSSAAASVTASQPSKRACRIPMAPDRITGCIGRHRPERVMTPTGRASSIRGMTSAIDAGEQPQSAAAPSPFPPIADYAFLSNCHTGALIAPDGGIGWLCVPRFDSPSVFGTLLDRQAGHFRLGPFAAYVPAARAYEPGTNTLVTTWQVPTGWIVVRDALTLGPRRSEDRITPHTRPPFDDDADHMLVRTVECIEGSVDIDLVCEPVFDYGRVPGGVDARGRRPARADATGAGLTLRLTTDLLLGLEGDRVRARAAARSRVSGRSARSRGRRSSRRRPTSTRRPSGWRRRRGSGAPGSAARGSPITAGASRSSARRSRSRA